MTETIAIEAWQAVVRANIDQTGGVRVTLDLDRKHLAALAVEAFRLMREDERGFALGDILSLSEQTAKTVLEVATSVLMPAVAKS